MSRKVLVQFKVGEAKPKPFQELRNGAIFIFESGFKRASPDLFQKISEHEFAAVLKVGIEGFEHCDSSTIDNTNAQLCYPVA